MNHTADRIRLLGGFFLLSNVLIFFLPILTIQQENYPEQTYSQLSFVRNLLSSDADSVQLSASGGMRFVTVLFILFPLILSLGSGVLHFVKRFEKKYVAGMGVAAGCLYFCQIYFEKLLWPKRLNDAQIYSRRIGWWLLLAVAFGVLITEGVSLFIFFRKQRFSGAKVSIQPRGVMVGVAGVFQGREISLKPGETIQIGRDLTNDLVFTDAAHVSRSHCSITWLPERQKYLIEDRSSNGCFINGALERLPKNVQIALDPGTVVDIGDRTNRFRLD